MSLATRCTACGTVFRVVQDQLKVSEGWVRCGRCNEVFNALEGLLDLERDSPPELPPAAGTTVPAATADESGGSNTEDDAGDAPSPTDATSFRIKADSIDAIDKIDAQLMGSREAGHDSTPATRISERDRLDFPDAQFGPDLADDIVELGAPVADLPAVEAQPDAGEHPAEAPNPPGFMQHAQHRARWSTPRMRALQAAAVVLPLAALALQGVHQFRDVIAARWPSTEPALAAWCSIAACRIEAPRRIEDVAVESTALARAAASDAFRLSVVLRNRGATVVALPSVDLSLTDANGQLISRRMLAPRDFRVASTTIRPDSESTLQLVLSTGGNRVTGYAVEVFYP